MTEERRFPKPQEIETIPGTEGWEEMYPYHFIFSKENPEVDGFAPGQQGFWYQDAIHLPRPLFPILAEDPTHWRWMIGQQNNHLLCVPPAGGVPMRIVNGYLYNSTVFVEDMKTVMERAELFPARVGHYFHDWRKLIDDWKTSAKAILSEGKKLEFPDLSTIRYADESYLVKGYGPADELYTNWLKLIEYHHQVYCKHFELQSIGYMGYMGFNELCHKLFPKMSDYRITSMLQGFEADSLRGDAELKKLSKLAAELGIGDMFFQDKTLEAIFGDLEKSEAGRKWLAKWEEVKDPWLLYTGGSMGLDWNDKLWKDDTDLPLSFLRGYIKTLKAGGNIERDVKKVAEEADRTAAEYGKLLPDDTRKQFEQQRSFAQTCLFFAEDHQLYIHGWALVQHHEKLKELAKNFVSYGMLEDVDDIKFMKQSEVRETLIEVMVTWSNYPEKIKPKGAYYWPAKIAKRKEIFKRFAEWTPPRALGYPPKEVKEPYSAMLWGITPQKMERWLDQHLGIHRGEEDVLTGMPGSAGIFEGPARVIKDIYETSQLQDGEILVTFTTTPDWGPVFVRLKGIVLDGGGVMSHAAIIAREYGIPCVVGTGNATRAIKTGDIVKVDGESGVVEIVRRAS